MRVSELQNGDIAVFEDVGLGMFLKNTFIGYSFGGRIVKGKFVEYTDGIKKVIRPTYTDGFQANMQFWLENKKFLEYDHEVLWEKEPEVKEVTMSEIEKKFGCKVKVVK